MNRRTFLKVFPVILAGTVIPSCVGDQPKEEPDIHAAEGSSDLVLDWDKIEPIPYRQGMGVDYGFELTDSYSYGFARREIDGLQVVLYQKNTPK